MEKWLNSRVHNGRLNGTDCFFSWNFWGWLHIFWISWTLNSLHSSVGGHFDRQANGGGGLTQRQDYQTRWLRQLPWLLYHFTGQSHRLANRLDTAWREDWEEIEAWRRIAFTSSMYGLILFAQPFFLQKKKKNLQRDGWWKAGLVWMPCLDYIKAHQYTVIKQMMTILFIMYKNTDN